MIHRSDLTKAIRHASDEYDRAALIEAWEKEYMDTWALTVGDRVIELGPAVNYTAACLIADARGYPRHEGYVQETGGTVGVVQDCPVCDRFGHLGIEFVLEHWEDLICEVRVPCST